MGGGSVVGHAIDRCILGILETGKSTSISAALAMFGCAHNIVFTKGTNASMLEHSSRSTLLYGLHDPSKGKETRSNALDISKLCIDLYNGQQ